LKFDRSSDGIAETSIPAEQYEMKRVLGILLVAFALTTSAQAVERKVVLLGGFGWPVTSHMDTWTSALAAKGFVVESGPSDYMPDGRVYAIIGHSLGAVSAAHIAHKTGAKKVFFLDPPWGLTCPARVQCYNLYAPATPLVPFLGGFGAQVDGGSNTLCDDCGGHIGMSSSENVLHRILRRL
jgi:hypothetical protein